MEDYCFDDPIAFLYLSGYLDKIMNKKPLLKREWDVEDFCQELSFNYIRKVSEEKRQSLSDDHKQLLLKRMAVQLSNDKLREMQRLKRDCRRERGDLTHDLASTEENVLDTLCDEEAWQSLRSKIDDETWLIFCMRVNHFRWDRIANQMNRHNPDAMRMKYCRKIKRVATLFQEAKTTRNDRASRQSA